MPQASNLSRVQHMKGGAHASFRCLYSSPISNRDPITAALTDFFSCRQNQRGFELAVCIVTVVVVVLFDVHGRHLWSSGRSVIQTTLFLGRLSPPKRLTSNTFASNWQLPFSSQRKEKRKYVAGPGIEPVTSGSRVRRATDGATRPGIITELTS